MNRHFLTKLATKDIKDIYQYINEQDADAALDFITRIQLMCDKLAQMPQMGRARDELKKGLRSFPVGNYLIFYRIVGTDIQVVRVLHGARNIKQFFSK